MKTARVFANGRSLAVRIPKEWLIGIEEVILERKGPEIRLRPRWPSGDDISEEFRKDPVEIRLLPQTMTAPKEF